MRTILTGCLAIIMAFTVGMDYYTRFAAPQTEVYTVGPQTYQISVDDEGPCEVIIPVEGDGPVYHMYESNSSEPTEASVVVSLTIDENGNIVG